MYPADNQRKRTPPIKVPLTYIPPRYLNASPTKNGGQPQQDQQQQQQQQQHQQQEQPQKQTVSRNASSSIQQGPRSAKSELTFSSAFSSEHGDSCPPNSGSQRSRASALATLSSMMEQARASPRKSETGKSEADSTRVKSTTRSKHSVRSQHSAKSSQAQVETNGNDERTPRAKIEARSEQNLFKITGQVPPTPMTESVGQDEVIITRRDLRKQCRAVSEERKADPQQPPPKSPKKKLFGMHIPTFGRTSTPAPPMPSKAAQVFGQAPRNPTIAVLRPIKPAMSFKTPTKAPRSDTTKSLPAKILNQDSHTRSHHSGAARRNRAANRRSPPGKQSSDTENTPPMPRGQHSFGSGPPPTPPAKDTPPENREQPVSPLRRTAPSDQLREKYATDLRAKYAVDGVLPAHLPFPGFAPSPLYPYHTQDAGKSPKKYQPCTADEYQELIGGDPLPWGSTTTKDDSSGKRSTVPETMSEGKHEEQPQQPSHSDCRSEGQNRTQDSRDAFCDSLHVASPRFHPPTSEEYQYTYSDGVSREYSPLKPRFYSPSNRSVETFAEGETPSKNSDTSRLLYTVFAKAVLLRPEDSYNGSIDMLYQGDTTDIDPQSSTGHLINDSVGDDSDLTARVVRELHVGEEKTPRQKGANGANGHLQPDQSSSRLTDMLHAVSPGTADFQGRFQSNCPSAVPSPLHKLPGPDTPMQALRLESGLFGPVITPKSIHDHFYMTNEHIDVLGKSTWDMNEALKKEMHENSSTRHAQLVATVEELVRDVKMQVDSVNEKVDRNTEQDHNIHTKLEKLVDFVKGDVMGSMATQDKRMADMEHSVREVHKALLNMQKMLEQQHIEHDGSQPHAITMPVTASPPGLPGHRSQPSLAGYYGNMTESGRESQPPMPHMEARWGPRANFQGRSSREERPYEGTSPYHFANGAANGGGQFGNGYGNGYPNYGQ